MPRKKAIAKPKTTKKAPRKSQKKRVTKQNGKGVGEFFQSSGIEWHVPGYQFLGPGTKFREREARGERGINALDNLAYHHDKAYNTNPAYSLGRLQADKTMINKTEQLVNSNAIPLSTKILAKTVVLPALKLQLNNNATGYAQLLKKLN